MEDIIKPIDVMTDDELIAIVTFRKENFNEDFRKKVLDELSKREIKLEDIFNTTEFKINFDEFDKIDRTEANGKVSLLKEPLDVLYFKNYMQQILAVQKTPGFYVLHHYDIGNGFSSFFLYDEDELKNSINEFLALGKWLPEDAEIIVDWDNFAESSSEDYILRLVKLLDEAGVNYSLNSNHLIRFTAVPTAYSIVMPVEEVAQAETVMEKIEELKSSLYEKLEEAEESDNTDKQIEILTELESVTPEDSALFYNKAQLLDAKGEYQLAANALIESFNLDYSEGIIDDIDDTENYLKEMLGKCEDKKNILHCLATIAAHHNDIESGFDYYKQLVALDEKDAIAHLNLGHHYYSNTEEDEPVKFHFKKFLELEPESPERESIEAILENLD
jgi:tetratricopeptide (TPR) repeat protein